MADWTRKLLKRVEVGRRKLRTVHDLRAHLLTLPEEVHDKSVWRATEAVLRTAEDGDVKRAAETFRLARFVHRD